MNTLEKVLLALALSLSLIIGVYVVSNPASNSPKFGSVEVTSEYQSTTTRAAFNGTALTSPSTLTTGGGTFGSVTITGANTGIINIYDGTTTAAHSDRATTTLATFPASTAAGTYTFDVAFKDGLLYEVIGTVGSSTITFRK